MPKLWFGRRRKPAKLKEGPSTGVTEGNRPVAASDLELPNNDALKKTPSRRSSRRKRTSSRSTASMRDPEKTSPTLPPVDPPFARHSQHNRPQGSVEDITALPFSKRLEQSPHLRPITQEHGIPYNFQSGSHASLSTPRERGKLQRPQSLRKSVNESTLVRRKSSKKRPHDSVREEEIRAMSMPLPQKRPAGNSGGMLRRESKKVKGGLNRHFERPTSNISLPVEESIHSSMSGSSETRAWRVSALDMFSPRPTVRCSVGSQYYYTGAGPSPTSDKGKNDSRRDRHLVTSRDGKEEGGRRSNRIDDLADTLDAGALRDILERDKRRRDKKRKQEEERLRRRLERRAEREREIERSGHQASTPHDDTTAAATAATAPDHHIESNSAVGLGIGRDVSTPMEDVRPTTPPQPKPAHIQNPETPTLASSYHEYSQLPTPLETPTVADAQAVRYSRASVSPTPHAHGHARESSNVSQMPELLSETIARETPVQSVEFSRDLNSSGTLHAVETTDTAATTSRKGSFGGWARRRSSEGRHMGVFAALFRRGKRNSQDQGQGRTTPSEVSFSNTSRESMSRQPLPAHLVAPTASSQQVHVIRRPSSVPRRTMSKFREDLPEFPLSPPDSRVQSPELTSTAASAIATRRRSQPLSDVHVGAESPATGARTDSPVSPGVPSTNIMSQSLASVDSEGSWLSGKPVQRRSNKSHLRSSVGSLSAINKRNEEFNNSYEELGIPDDEYFRRLTPQPDERRRSITSADMLARKASSTAMAAVEGGDSDHEDAAAGSSEAPNGTIAERPSQEEERVVSSVGRQPTIIHRQPRVKSTEGLLSYFEADKPSTEEKSAEAEAAAEQESPTSESGSVLLQRARSVDLGKHHSRQLSAGSAKLLSIPAKRSSADPKRASLGSQTVLSQE